MPLFRRCILAVVLNLVCCITAVALLSGTAPAPVIGAQQNTRSVLIAEHVSFPVVHLRKLHLVRPDLIPYPIYYEIYC